MRFLTKDVDMMMPKKIILVDRINRLTELILNNTDWNIALLLDHPNQEALKKSNRVEICLQQKDLYGMSDFSGIDFSLIKKLKSVQGIGDYGSYRSKDDLNYSRYVFYNCVGFFSKIFSQKIDLCVITALIHGITCDYLLAEMARCYKVPCLTTWAQAYKLHSIYNYNDSELISLCYSEMNYHVPDDVYFDSARYYYQKTSNINTERKSLKEKAKSISFKIGGNLLQTFISFLYYGHYYRDIWLYKCTYIFFLRRYLEYKDNEKYMSKYYCSPDLDSPYIVYYLHFEPEAVITTYANVMDSQLVAIGMLAQSLPQGWTLYVKEHPDLHKLNWKEGFSPFIPAVASFYTKWFIDKLRSFPNTKIVPFNYPSTPLMKNSKAIASVHGTVLKEGIISQKPILVFANRDRSFLGKVDGVFFIESMNDIVDAMGKIVESGYQEYSNYLSVCKRYLFFDDELGWEFALKMIIDFAYQICS